ncbi:MAG: NAD(+) synthase [Alphaproteobacteria bacterium]|nr:NAD(+) synthase [Alphaproteobacteria bacterium]
MAPLSAHIAAATLNQTVGDWAGNTRRIVAVVLEARRRGVRLLVLPEMCIPGYSLGDRLLMRGTIDRSWQCLENIAATTAGMVVLVGLPVQHRDVLYNVVAVVADGEIRALVPKENLATGDVQYENRWFSGWPRGRVESFDTPDGRAIPFGSMLFEAQGIGRFGVEVCEDGWKGNRPGSGYALAGATIVCNPSASWFVLGKHRVRRDMVEQISREDHVVYCYTSLLGCDATKLIFDGSVFLAQDGELIAEGRRFLFGEEWELVDRVVDLASLARTRMEEGSWRQQVESIQRGELGELPEIVKIPGRFHTQAPPPATAPYWETGTVATPSADPSLDWLVSTGLVPAFGPLDLPHLELELALCLALREYRVKCGIPGFTLALSGGRDSAMCAVLVARGIRYDNPGMSEAELRAEVAKRFTTAYMATDNSGSVTRTAARTLAEELGTTHYDGAIQDAFDTHLALCHQMTGTRLTWDDPKHDVPLQNVQARLRGSLIWMIANLNNSLLIATSNKSEAAVGYATMDGDTSGGIAPIADVPKSLVSLWLAWAARFHGMKSLATVTHIPATAELRPPSEGQTDEDDLMPFAVLDQLMYHFVQRGMDPLQMFRTLWPSMRERYGDDPTRFAAHIEKFVKLFCRAQWKRERFAISFRVTAFDLDPKTGFRFPPVQAPFTEELAELALHLHHLTEGDHVE